MTKTKFLVVALLSALTCVPESLFAQPNVRHLKTKFSMRMKMDNRGSFGRVAYPSGTGASFPGDSLGLEYPAGEPIEHIFGGGIWIGALLDTSQVPNTNPRIKAVTTAYEGYQNPLFEMFPGSSPADSFWIGNSRNPVTPPGWAAYWGNNFPFRPISDNDLYCTYTDYNSRPAAHVPLGIKVIQHSYTWEGDRLEDYANGIVIIEYKIINTTNKSIDSTYIGFFVDADVGPFRLANYQTRNFTGYDSSSYTAFIHNPRDRGSTPVGVSLLSTSKDRRTLKYTFQWYPLAESPQTDPEKYDLLRAGGVEPSQTSTNLSDTRFLYGFGPFSIKPANDPLPDTLTIAVAILCGEDLNDLILSKASHALNIYLNQGIKVPNTPPSPPLRVIAGDRRVTLDWKWRPGDDVLFGRPDPETNWDTTNQVARLDPRRYVSRPGFTPPPGVDSTRGGRNFEAFRIWRSENPDAPEQSYTLLKQVDVPSDSFEYNTGLEYAYVDSNLVRGKTYVYAVTSRSIPNIAVVGGNVNAVQPLESSLSSNAVKLSLPFAVSKTVGKVTVVPNPYRTDQDYRLEAGGYEGLTSKWDENRRTIKFINLPERCTIRIFSLSGDLVRTVLHEGGGGAFPVGDEDVLLLSESNRALASGIYIFTVDSDLGSQTGKFVIIR